MPNSQNGYQVLDADRGGPWPHLRDFALPNLSRELPARDGSAGFLLVHIALWFDLEIEDLQSGVDDWGWSPRRIGNTDIWSNHASGTALDLNATKHPQGAPARNTFSPPAIARIHHRLLMYEGCIRWGGDYQSLPDAMHFELNRPIDQVVLMANNLVNTKIGRMICDENPGLRAIIVD